MTKETVCLITPPSIFLLDERVFVSLGILKVAAVLERSGYGVEHLDLSGIQNFEEALEDHARGSPAKWFGLTTTTPQLPAVAKIIRRIRAARPDAKIVLGGPHPTLVQAAFKREQKLGIVGRGTKAMNQLLDMCNVVVAGDGEDSILQVLRSTGTLRLVDADDPKGPLFLTSKRLEETPFPARHLVDFGSYNYSVDGVKAASLVAQLGCPFGCRFSVTGDTFVFAAGGPVRVDSFTRGVGIPRQCEHGGVVLEYPLDQEVASPQGRAVVSVAVSEGLRPVNRLTLEGGLSIKTTAEHEFMSVEADSLLWRRADQLVAGMFVAIRQPEIRWGVEPLLLTPPIFTATPPGGFSRRESHSMPTTLDDQLAWLCGFVVGDGSLPTDGRPSFHVCITDTVEGRLVRAVHDLFGVELAISDASNTTEMRHGWVHSRLAREVLVQSVGIDPSNKLRIPEIFWRSPRQVMIAFLEGLFDADAYRGKGSGFLTTVSEQLAHEVAFALLAVGKGCPSIRFYPPREGDPRHGRGQYRVGVLDNDRIPTTQALYRSKTGVWRWRAHRSKRGQGIRRRTLRESGLTHPLAKDGWFYARVESNLPVGVEPVYDLKVPGEHAFVANGLVAHNCGGRESSMLRKIRTRSTASILRELEMLYTEHGIKGFMFYDDELNVSKSMVELMQGIVALQERLGVEFRLRGFVKSELFNEEQAEWMYRAGFRWLLCGFESGHPRILSNIAKRATVEDNFRMIEAAHKHKLKVKALMSVGHPGESEETVRATQDWLLQAQPEDFDVTIITTYPGTPYYDHAVETSPGIWTYTVPENGDRLHSLTLDYTETADYYKGDPDGGYTAYVYTDHLSSTELVRLRDGVERTVRQKLNIPFNAGAPAIRYEHSMGQTGPLPVNILKSTAPSGSTP